MLSMVLDELTDVALAERASLALDDAVSAIRVCCDQIWPALRNGVLTFLDYKSGAEDTLDAAINSYQHPFHVCFEDRRAKLFNICFGAILSRKGWKWAGDGRRPADELYSMIIPTGNCDALDLQEVQEFFERSIELA